jgi:hypothetical protein
MIQERENDDIINQNGEGIFLREKGLEPPSFRKLLKEVGDEVITKLTVWREPISVNKLIKFFKINTGYDDLFHLALNINNKYNLDKQAVLTFTRGKPKGETLQIGIPANTTIKELIDKTKARMGPEKYSSYSSKTNNCQLFLLNVLEANSILTDEARKFIEQDTETIFKGLPKYAPVISDLLTGAQAVINRLQEGEGQSSNSRINATGLIDVSDPTLVW